MSKTTKAILVIIGVLLIDQIIKIWIKTSFNLFEERSVIGNWFKLHFTENSGMAFGMKLGGKTGKLLLSIFRLIAIVGIAFYLRHLIRNSVPTGLIISISLILAGAIGNMIDSAFYGLIFSHSFANEPAYIFPPGGGYAGFLHGNVVDMLYFPIISGHYPDWFPFWGGNQFIFFRPVFNIADSAITIGVSLILVFQRKYFKNFQ
ncbi:MAG: lipoprotein signal peptidase [Bacteroidales bacterium]|nr:lipoprotein signal peptidase [Bacteroidales bacterium]